MNPLTILSIAFSGWILILGWSHPLVSCAFVLGSWTFAVTHSRSLTVPLAVLGLTFPIALSMFVVHSPHGDNSIAAFITTDGLAIAGELALRFAALMSCFLTAMVFISISDLVKSLQISPLGPKVAYIVGAALQFLPEGQQAIKRARDANALDNNRVQLKNVVPLVVLPVITQLLDAGASRGKALENLGFDIPGKRSVLRPVSDSAMQKVTRFFLPFLAVAAIVWI